LPRCLTCERSRRFSDDTVHRVLAETPLAQGAIKIEMTFACGPLVLLSIMDARRACRSGAMVS
jgi:hypothetical protein